MAFQQSTSEDSAPANAQYFIPFGGIVDSSRPYTCTDDQAIEPASSLITPRSDILLAGEIVPRPVSERCLPAPLAYSYLRGASMRGDLGSMVIRCLPSSSDYDISHPSLDAHSAPPRADLVENESFVFGPKVPVSGPNVCRVQLRTSEIQSRLQPSAGTVNPVSVEIFCANNSAITQVSINGLCQDIDTSHISILGMKFTSQMSCGFRQMLTQVKSIKCFILHPSESQAQFIGAINCTWNPISGFLTASIVNFLSHVKIFYWKSSCIELYMELCCERAIHSATRDLPHPAFGIKPSQSFIMAPLHDNDHNNLPNVSITLTRDELPEVNAALDDEANSTINTTEAACTDGSFRIKLNSAQLYSIIKEGLVGAPYPEVFRMIVPVSDHKFTVLLKVFPFKSRSEHISVWAEVTAPPHARGQVTLQVTAFDPRKEQRLGHTIECTEKLKRSDCGDCKKAKFTLDEVMLHMFAFYKIPDIELCISIAIN